MNGKLNSQTVKIVFGWITTAVILRFYFVITSNFLKIKTISNSRSFPFFSSFSQLTDLVKRLAQDDLNPFHLPDISGRERGMPILRCTERKRKNQMFLCQPIATQNIKKKKKISLLLMAKLNKQK